jgi:hypothetical protein
MIDKLLGYVRTIQQYFSTAKGYHDLKDESFAIFVILVTMLLVYLVVKYIL